MRPLACKRTEAWQPGQELAGRRAAAHCRMAAGRGLPHFLNKESIYKKI